MSCKTNIQPSGIIGGNLGALATVEGLTPIVLTLASHTVGNRLGKTRKSRGGNMGTVALPALLVVANDQVYKMLGKSKTVKGGRRGRGRRGRHIYTKKVRGGDEEEIKLKDVDSSNYKNKITPDIINQASKFIIKYNRRMDPATIQYTYNTREIQTDNKTEDDIYNELQRNLLTANPLYGVYYIRKPDTNLSI